MHSRYNQDFILLKKGKGSIKVENFFYIKPVPIDFRAEKLKNLPNILKRMNLTKGILISTPSMLRSGIADEIMRTSDGRIMTVFSDIQPNPTIHNTDACSKQFASTDVNLPLPSGAAPSWIVPRQPAMLQIQSMTPIIILRKKTP